MRVAIALSLLLLVLPVGALMAADKPVITINVSGDTVEYDQEQRTVAVRGNVHITAQSDRPGVSTVSLAAEQLEGNLGTGEVIAQQGVRLLSQQVALRGELVKVNFQTDDFILEKGAASVEVESETFPGRVVRGFFFGDKITRQANIVYIINARVTTCDRQNPHYSIGARSLTYDQRTGGLTIHQGRLQLYGLNLRLPGSYTTHLASTGGGGGMPIPLPGYSSYNGLYLPFQRSLLPEDSDWSLLGTLRVGTKFQLPGSLVLQRTEPDEVITAMVTRREDVTWDLDKRSRISRLPELRYWRGFDPTLEGVARLQGSVFAGHVVEHAPDFPRVSASRLGVSLSYSGTPRQRQDHRGPWWATDLDQTVYDDGEHLRDLRLEAGYGLQVSDDSRAALWGIHHLTSGSTPFLFDDVFVEDELLGEVSTKLARNWAFDLYGRYDLDDSELRDYSVKLSRRMHCLTWSLKYERAGQTIGIGLDLNGVTGNTRPTATRPLVTPDEVLPLPEIKPPAAAQPHL
ncbi:MAG: hypothetical protein ABFD96_01505 [Armatimonadia bacterium]